MKTLEPTSKMGWTKVTILWLSLLLFSSHVGQWYKLYGVVVVVFKEVERFHEDSSPARIVD